MSEFMECDTCRHNRASRRARALLRTRGAPSLCKGCLHNRELIGQLKRELAESGRTCMDDCSACEGPLDVIGVHRTGDGRGGMKHVDQADCIDHLKVRLGEQE